MVNILQTENELIITRIFNAPRELVWKFWVEPVHLKKWWGPKDFTAPFSENDVRVGGRYLNAMRGPDGRDYWSTGVYREVKPPERFVMTDSFADEHGKVVPGTYYGMSPDFPLELQIEVTFEEEGPGKTRMTLRHSGIPAGEMSKRTAAGWEESFDKLDEYLTNTMSG